MTDAVNLPARLGTGATLEDMARVIGQLQDYIEAREPTSFGGRLDKFLTIGETVQAGLLSYALGGTAGGAAGDYVVPGLLTSNPADTSLPTPISGIVVASGVGYYMVEVGAPTYTQGGGNGRTIIYSANYSGAGPLPTFSDAVQAGTIPGRGTILVVSAEPGVQTHFWAKAETRHPTLQANPTGGLNGVTSTADLIENQHVLSLSAAKLTAGSVSVSEYIQSTGFVSGSAGWKIKGDGTAEFSGVIVRGTLYATAGTIGGIEINAESIHSTNFNGSFNGSGGLVSAGTAGWAISYAGVMVLDVAHIRDSKVMAQTRSTNIYSGAATSTITAEQMIAKHVGNGFAAMTGCSGYLRVYLDTSAARLVEITYLLFARETTSLDEVYGPTIKESRTLEGGYDWSASGAYRYKIPFSTSWLFGGKYWSSGAAYEPGTSGAPITPTQINNFLVSGTWNIYVSVTIDCYTPATSTPVSNIEDVLIAASGWLQGNQGSISYEAPSPII